MRSALTEAQQDMVNAFRRGKVRWPTSRQPRILSAVAIAALTEAQQALADAMSEKQLQDAIVDLAHRKGWQVAHFGALPLPGRFRTNKKGELKPIWSTPVQGDAEGFPDLVIAKEFHASRFWECKTEKGKVTPEQQAWLDLLCGRVVRPSDWLSGKIQEMLA